MFMSLFASPLHARSSATKLLEQAVSMFADGPLKLKNQLRRLANIDGMSPVIAWLNRYSGSLLYRSFQSFVKQPVYTAVFEPLTCSTGKPAGFDQ